MTVSLARTKSEARVWKEDVCVALVKLTLETLFLVLSEIVSSCFPFNCLLCALHVLFLCFCLYLPFTSPLPSPSLPPWWPKAAPTGGRQTPFPCRPLPGDPDPAAGRRKAASCCHLLTRFFHQALGRLFSVILSKKQEIAGGTVISVGPEKVDVCLGMLHPNPGVLGCSWSGI